jgi:hypothetical protein
LKIAARLVLAQLTLAAVTWSIVIRSKFFSAASSRLAGSHRVLGSGAFVFERPVHGGLYGAVEQWIWRFGHWSKFSEIVAARSMHVFME